MDGKRSDAGPTTPFATVDHGAPPPPGPAAAAAAALDRSPVLNTDAPAPTSPPNAHHRSAVSPRGSSSSDGEEPYPPLLPVPDAPPPPQRAWPGPGPGSRSVMAALDPGGAPQPVDRVLNVMGFTRLHALVLCFTGLAWFAAALEVMLLSVLGPAVRACGVPVHVGWHGAWDDWGGVGVGYWGARVWWHGVGWDGCCAAGCGGSLQGLR